MITYDYSGIVFRIWGVAGMLILLGVIALLLYIDPVNKFNKTTLILSICCILIGLVRGATFASYLISPKIDSTQCTFSHRERNSRVAPPLPVTMEYNFYDANGKLRSYYLDVFSRKEIIPEDFTENQEYIIYFEINTNVIVAVELVNHNPD